MNRPDSSPAVELAAVTKRYKRASAVEHLDLTIPHGMTLGLIGPNGAGKSTTIRMLMGTLAPTSGSVRVLGIDVQRDPVAMRRRVGYVPERHDFYPWMRVREVIAFARPFYPTWDDEFCREMLELFQLEAGKRIKQLSKGMMVKLGLLLAVSHRPELLVLDEPTSGLDPIVHEDFLDGVMKSIQNRKTTVLFSSHNLADIHRLADSVCILHAGKIVVRRAMKELLAGAKRVRVMLATDDAPRWIPQNVIWQQQRRREWLLTIDQVDDDLAARIKSENAADSIELFDVTLDGLFRDYIVGGNAR
jgi:ABC-2 type transport system ATP-binding protein